MKTVGIALALALAGCGSGTTSTMDPEPVEPQQTVIMDAPPPPTMTTACTDAVAEIGSGAREYEPVKSGDTVYLFHGPQGGYMIYIGVRAKGLDPSLVYVDYEERFADSGALFGVGQWKVQLTNPLADGWYERVGIWGEIEPEWWTKPSAVRDKDVVMKVKLTDAKGCVLDGLGWTVHVSPDKPL